MQKNYDVIIIGLGTAGAISLIKCAKLGLSVLGIERISEMGGTGTAGGIGCYYYGSKGGYYEEINKKAMSIQKEYFKDTPYEIAGTKSLILEQEALNAGAEFLYNTHVLSVNKEGQKIISIKCIKEGKTFDVSAKLFIDTTGNADFSYLCGCEFIGGRDSDNIYMPYTNPVFIADPSPRVLNRDSGLIDMSDNTSYSKELLNSTAQYPFSEKVRGVDATFLKIAPLPGVRESRKVVCEKTVTFEDAISQKPCDETVFYAFSNADTHEKCIALENDFTKDWYVACNLWGVCMSVAIPMSALIPKGIDNLLCGGRILSVCHTLSSVVRMKSDMEKCGEVLSFMSYLKITENCAVKDIPYSKLNPYLLESKVLDENNNVGFLNRTKTSLEPLEFSETLEDLEKDLDSERESFGVFAAKNIENSADFLAKIQNSTERKGKYAAIALGRMGDKRAIPVLREILENRDLTLPSGLKMTVPLGVTSIYLLGKLKDKQSISLLKQIIIERGSFNKELFTSTEMFPTEKDLSFQFITHSVATLKELALSFSDIKEDIINFLKENFVDNDYNLTDGSNSLVLNIKAGLKLTSVTYDHTDVIRNFILS